MDPKRSRWRGNRVVIMLGGVLLGAGMIVGHLLPQPADGRPGAVADSAEGVRRSGRWGVIVVTPFWLEPSAQVVGQFQPPDQRPVWRLPGENRATVMAFLQRAGLAPDAIAALLAPGVTFEDQRGVTILPNLEQLFALKQSSRQVIYECLALLPGNPYHEYPLMSARETTSWLTGFDLSAEQRHAFVKLLWRRGPISAFSDPSALIQLAKSSHEIAEVTRLFGRTSAVRIRVARGSDAAAFVDYWSAGGRNRDALPLLRSMAEGDEGAVDGSLLLPSICRERLYTHPSLADAIGGQLPDCNWTTLSFFADPPRRYLLDPKAAGLLIEQNYERIPAPSQLGDVVCFINAQGDIEHSCVHVVDDVVFTKNGASPLAPWVLQRFVETAAIYGERRGNTVKFFRLKGPAAGP